MATEAQKVIPGRHRATGAEVSAASIHQLVDTIAGMLLELPPAYRLQVLRQVEAKIAMKPVAREGEIVRKVYRWGRAFAIAMPVRFNNLVGEYDVQAHNNTLIYERMEGGEVKVRKSGTAIRIPIPKWAYETMGFPGYVRVRVEGSRIIVEPA